MNQQHAAGPRSRWVQLVLGLLCMIVISSPQYVWTLFTQPLIASLHTRLAAIQITFSILIVVQTFLSPCQGFLVDKFGPRLLLSVGGAVTGLSWVLASHVTTLTGLYLTYGLLGGIGTGIVYVGVIGHMVQWFPDRRGFATGIVAAGYGMGALLTTFPIAESMNDGELSAGVVSLGPGLQRRWRAGRAGTAAPCCGGRLPTGRGGRPAATGPGDRATGRPRCCARRSSG